MPVRTRLTPSAATSASPSPPPGVLARPAARSRARSGRPCLRPRRATRSRRRSSPWPRDERTTRRRYVAEMGLASLTLPRRRADRGGRADRRVVLPARAAGLDPDLDPVLRLRGARAELPRRRPARAGHVPTTRGRIPQTSDIDEFGGEGWLEPMLVRIEGQDVWIPAGGKTDEEVEELIEESRERLLQGEPAHSLFPQPPRGRAARQRLLGSARGSRGARRAGLRPVRARARQGLGRARPGRPGEDRGDAVVRGGTDRRPRRRSSTATPRARRSGSSSTPTGSPRSAAGTPT